MSRVVHDCRDRVAPVKVTSPHASWERLGAGILDTRNWCYERTPEGVDRYTTAQYEARAALTRKAMFGLGAVRVKPMPHFDALIAEAERVGWPRGYRNDLYVHDLHTCDYLDPSEPFVWVLRDLGTHLYCASFDGNFSGREGFDRAPKSIAECFGVDKCRFYTWDGRYLMAHKTPEACAERARVLGEQWRREQEERGEARRSA